NLLTIIGGPGLGKSRLFQDAVGPDACLISGSSTAFGLYCTAFEHRHRHLLLDDVDNFFRDRVAVQLLKSLCQTDDVKALCWNSAAPTLKCRGVPRKYTTRSKVAVLTNDWPTSDANLAALLDRGHVILFEPSPLEVHLKVAEWFPDQQVYDFIGEH